MAAAVHQGWLKKKSPSAFAVLQNRFFVLSADALLSYYKNEGDKEPKGVIPLSALKKVVAAGTSLDVDVGYRQFHMVASTSSDASAWEHAIRRANVSDGGDRVGVRTTEPGANPFDEGATAPTPRGGDHPTCSCSCSSSANTNANANSKGKCASKRSSASPGGVNAATSAASASAVLPTAPPQARRVKELRPGVLLEGFLLKSPPQLSVRRFAEETRLQQRWFILSNRSLQWFADATVSKPLSSVPLKLITQCEPKRGGKHPGKFYLRTESRLLKIVAADAETMAEWVHAINDARECLEDLRETSSFEGSERISAAGGSGPGPSGPVELPECVKVWEAARRAKGKALDELALGLTKHVGEEFGGVEARDDVDAIIEVADRCAEQMCGVLDDVLSYLQAVGGPQGSDKAAASDVFAWYLSQYHGSVFAHLGGFFLNEEALGPTDALALFCWVQGYHAQLGRLQVDVAALKPSLSELARDLIAASSAAFGRHLAQMPDEEAFECELPISITNSGRANPDRSSAHETTLELKVHAEAVSYLRSAEESLRQAPLALSEVLGHVVPEMRHAFATLHPRLIAVVGNANDAMRADELITTAFNSAETLRELLTSVRARAPELEAHALEVLEGLLSDAGGLLRSLASASVAVFMQQPAVAKAAEALFTPEWATSDTSSSVRSLLEAADVHIKFLGSVVRPALLSEISRQVRAATVRAYMSALLTGSAKLHPSASSAMVRDIDVLVQWCDDVTAPRDGTGGPGAAADELAALDGLLEMVGADADDYGEAYTNLLQRHPDAPLGLAEAVLNRRPELSKGKKAALAACQAAIAQVRPDGQPAPDGLFAELTLMSKSSAKKGGGWFKK